MIKLGGIISRNAFVNEAESDKYTHIGYGMYKQKGKEKEKDAPTFKKDGDKYVPFKKGNAEKGGDTSAGEDKPKVNIFDKPKEKQPPKTETPPDSEKVHSTKLKDIMPSADKKTFSGKSDINKLSPNVQRKISMKIDELDKLAKEAKQKGTEAPNYNLCKITVKGTNLYCDNNLGIPRAEMPQFKGKPQPNTPASKMKADANGEVDTEAVFKEMLKKKGIKTAETEIPSDALKATQSELVGTKVAGMAKALEKDPNNPGITAPIYVSRDGYVIDGHHRWAAVTSNAIANGKPAKMKVIVIDDDAKNIIPMANKFAQDIGVSSKKADANQEGDNVDDLKKQRDKLVKRQDYLSGKVSTSYLGKKELQANNEKIKQIDDKLKSSKTTDSTKSRPGHPETNKFTRTLAKKAGFTPQKLGKDEYQKKMIQAAYSALEDSNFHDEARKLVATIENKPEWAKKPNYPNPSDPDFKKKQADLRKNSAGGSEYANADSNTDKFGIAISKKSDWDGQEALDAIAFDLKMNGFKDLASKMQSIFEGKRKSTKLTSMINEGIDPIGQITSLTGTRPSAVKSFVDTNKIDAKKLGMYLQKGNLRTRLDFSSALVGKDGNKFQTDIIKKFGMNESIINEERGISAIAYEIQRDWKQVNYAAKPYLQAMYSLDSINDKYGMDSGRGVVARFLSNASQWKGDTAKRIKDELKKMLK
jgi:hypothetical protein